MSDVTDTGTLRTLRNGAVYDMQQKRIVSNPGGGSAAFTQGNASALASARWQKARAASHRYIVREAAAIDPSVNTWHDAWGLVASKQFLSLMDSDKPRGDDLYRLGQIVGAVPLAGEVQAQASAAQPGAITLSLPAETGAALIELLRELAGRQIVDAETVDE